MKKGIIKFFVILIILGLIGFGVYYAYQKYKKQDPFELEWVRIYYDYMRQNHEDTKAKKNTLKYYREDEKIEFCQVPDIENPVMLYNYKELGQAFTNILYITEEKEVVTLQYFKKDFVVEYLYDVEEKTYDYYIHEDFGNEDKYTKISESIKANKVNEDEETQTEIKVENAITLKKGAVDSVTALDGTVLEISTFDEKFISINIIEDRWQNIVLDSYEDEIKKEFSKAVSKMQADISEKQKEKVSQKQEEIQTRKDEMIKAIQEIEQKRKEDEERRIAEEQARIKAEEEAKKKAEEEAKKQEEERKKAEEEAKKQEEERKKQEQAQARKLYIKIWNI